MHFARNVYHNPMYPAVDIEVTRGCTHNKCAFCSMYIDEPFRVTPIEIFKEDLQEVAASYPKVTKMQWLGGNPFALPAHMLKERAALAYGMFPELKHIGMFCHINDIKAKTDAELRELKALNIELFIGQESGDDWTLAFIHKGYTQADILEQSARLDEAGFTYGATFLGGLAPIGHSEDHAVHTAEVFNKLHPYMVGTGSLVLFPGSQMSRWAEEGAFTPLTELELMKELRLFLSILNIPCALTAHHSSALSIMGPFPKSKEQMLAKLDHAIAHYDALAAEMAWHRQHIRSM